MKPIPILADSRRRAQCRSCGAAIEWATHAVSHAAMPFNAPIMLERSLPLDERGPAVVHVDLAQTTSHFATCPQAGRWRMRARP